MLHLFATTRHIPHVFIAMIFRNTMQFPALAAAACRAQQKGSEFSLATRVL